MPYGEKKKKKKKTFWKSQLPALYWRLQRRFCEGSAGWKQPTQNNISSVHSSQPKHRFPYFICHWHFSFPLVYENSFKGLLTSLSNKRVTVINGVGYREKNSSMVVCFCHPSLTIESMFRFKLKHESGGQIWAAAPVRIFLRVHIH